MVQRNDNDDTELKPDIDDSVDDHKDKLPHRKTFSTLSNMSECSLLSTVFVQFGSIELISHAAFDWNRL